MCDRDIDTALLAISELVASVLRQGDDAALRIGVTVEVHPDRLHVAVTGPHAPGSQHHADAPAEGLGVVGMLAEHWGIDLRGTGHTVWCDLPRH